MPEDIENYGTSVDVGWIRDSQPRSFLSEVWIQEVISCESVTDQWVSESTASLLSTSAQLDICVIITITLYFRVECYWVTRYNHVRWHVFPIHMLSPRLVTVKNWPQIFITSHDCTFFVIAVVEHLHLGSLNLLWIVYCFNHGCILSVHRIGRTGRSGAKGVSTTFVSQSSGMYACNFYWFVALYCLR